MYDVTLAALDQAVHRTGKDYGKLGCVSKKGKTRRSM